MAVDSGAAIGSTLLTTYHVFGGGAVAASTVDPTTVGGLPAYGVEAFDGLISADVLGTPSTQAGGHPYAVSTSVDFTTRHNSDPLVGGPYPIEAPKDVVVDLPPGFVGDPSGVAACTLAQLANAEGVEAKPFCPSAAQVGTTDLRFPNAGGDRVYTLPVFNITPPPNVPARFGFNALGTVVVLDAGVRSVGGYRLTVTSHNTPEGIGIAGTTVTFWGVPADPSHDIDRACPGQSAPALGGPTCPSGTTQAAFLRNPTSCGDPHVGLLWTIRTDSWLHPGVFREASYAQPRRARIPLPAEQLGPTAWNGALQQSSIRPDARRHA